MANNKYGGLELFFDLPVTATKNISVMTNIPGLGQYLDAIDHTLTPIYVNIKTTTITPSVIVTVSTWMETTKIDESSYDLGSVNIETLYLRFVMDNLTVSIECNNAQLYTYTMQDINWPAFPQAKIISIGEDTTLENVIVSELHDPREAVYIDYEQTIDSAIQSIVQQRPIQQFAEVDRGISFTYNAYRTAVDAHHILQYSEQTRDSNQLSSDGLVYYTDVTISISEQTAKQIGFITRLYRLSELNSGALSAAAWLQKIALEKRKVIQLQSRFDPRLQVADKLLIDQTLSGTETPLVDEIIIEDISISLENGKYQMSITARRSF